MGTGASGRWNAEGLQSGHTRTVEESSGTQPPRGTGRRGPDETLESLGGQGARVKLEDGREVWLGGPELCLQLGLQHDDFYGRVGRGEIAVARDKARLIYRNLRDDSTYLAGCAPGDTLEMVSDDPPGPECVATLARLADELSDGLTRTRAVLAKVEDKREKAERVGSEALKLARIRTSEHASLSREHVAVHKRLGRYHSALEHSTKSQREANKSAAQVRAEHDRLVAGLRELANMRLAFPLRKRLLALIGDEPTA